MGIKLVILESGEESWLRNTGLHYKVRLETGFLTLTGPVMLASGYGVVGVKNNWAREALVNKN
jgi:hypothetical protein